jgi:acyl-CoA oxidase
MDLYYRWIEALPFLSDPKKDIVVEMHALLSVMKPIATANVQLRLQGLRELLAGHGYSRFNKIGQWRNDNDINLTWEGDNTVLIQQTARFIANSLNKKMKGKEVKYKTLSFLSKFDEVSNAKITISSITDLQNLEKLTQMLEYRMNVLLQKSVGRLAERVGNQEKVFDAWNNSQVFYLQNMARAYGELYVFNCFKEKVQSLAQSSTKVMLHKFLLLFTYSQLEKDFVILRENDYCSSEVWEYLKTAILDLCMELKDQLISIIDVIAPPDEILGAPLGSSTGNGFDSYLSHVFNAKNSFSKPEWWDIIHQKGG